MLSEHFVECQVLVGVSLDIVGLFFFYTSLYSRCAFCTWVCIGWLEISCPAIFIDRCKGQPIRNFYVKVKVSGEFIRFSCSMISVRKGVQVIWVWAIYPSAITVGNQVAILIVWTIPREHCIFGCIVILRIIRVFHWTRYVRFDSQPGERLVIRAVTEAVAVIFITFYGSFFTIISQWEIRTHFLTSSG